MRIEVPEAVARLGTLGAELYAAGGAPRDVLLGRSPSDWDLSGPARPEELCPLEGVEIEDAVNGLGTAALYFEGTRYEYTAFRIDSYGRDGEHRPLDVVFTNDIEADALRRDFTVNALYARLPDGEILDPLGGLADLRDRRIRMTRPETLEEDALRILRMVRFAAAYGFEVEEETWNAAKTAVPSLGRLSGERVFAELLGILMGDEVFGIRDAVARGLYMLRDLGAFDILIPELAQGRGVTQSPVHHRYDVLDHQIETCAAAPADRVTRLAALLHDVSKPEVLARDGNMHAHPRAGAQRTGEILRRLGASAALTADVRALVEEHMFDLDNRAGRKAALRRLNRLGRVQFERLADLRDADFTGSGMGAVAASSKKWRRMLEEMDERGAPFSVRDLAVNGNDLMRDLGLEPGPLVGETLRALLEYAQGGPSRNNYKSLLKYAKIWLTGAREARRFSSEKD